MGHYVHSIIGDGRPHSGVKAREVFVLKHELGNVLRSLEHGKKARNPAGTTPALLAHAQQLMETLERYIVDPSGVPSRHAEALVLRERLNCVQRTISQDPP